MLVWNISTVTKEGNSYLPRSVSIVTCGMVIPIPCYGWPPCHQRARTPKMFARKVKKCALNCKARFGPLHFLFSEYIWTGFCCFLCQGYSEPQLQHLSTVFFQLHGRLSTKDTNIYVRQKVTKGQIEVQHSLLNCQPVPNRLCQMQRSIILQYCQLSPAFVQDIHRQWVEAKGKEKQLMY